MTRGNSFPPPALLRRRQALKGLAGATVAAFAFRCLPLAAATPDATQAVRTFYDVLLATMQDGPKLGVKGRYERLAPAIDQTFDLPFMARTAVGPQWLNFSPSEREEVIKALRRYIVATYADNFDE